MAVSGTYFHNILEEEKNKEKKYAFIHTLSYDFIWYYLFPDAGSERWKDLGYFDYYITQLAMIKFRDLWL